MHEGYEGLVNFLTPMQKKDSVKSSFIWRHNYLLCSLHYIPFYVHFVYSFTLSWLLKRDRLIERKLFVLTLPDSAIDKETNFIVLIKAEYFSDFPSLK